MAKLLQRVVSDAANRVSQARKSIPELQRAETLPPERLLANEAENYGAEYREMLLRHVKKDVKQLMEEAVTRKFIHEESSTISSLCSGIDNCLQYGLRKRSLGLFKESTTLVLLHRIAKTCPQAQTVAEKLPAYAANGSTLNNNQAASKKPAHNQKFMWIRVALFEKCLAKIVEFLVQEGREFYEADSIIADACDGPLLASLLVGPCALDYTKVKTLDHYYSDPSADELVQRHRIHSPNMSPSSPRHGRQTSLIIRRHTSSGSDENLTRSAPPSAREYVELLHQNNRATLLFGKNNVMSQAAQHSSKVPGYLSLHHTGPGLVVKWTPNTLMLGRSQSDRSSLSEDSSPFSSYSSPNVQHCNSPLQSPSLQRRSYLRQDSASSTHSADWDNVLTIKVDNMVYIHCHANNQPSGATLVFVAQDGTQQPPFLFPPGGHLLAFLTCLENGLLPHGQLDPPLWSQRGKGKVFPKIKRKSIFKDNFLTSLLSKDREVTPTNSEPASCAESDQDLEEDSMDFVFRIMFRDSRFSFESLKSDSFSVDSAFAWQDSYSTGALKERFSDHQHQTSLKQLCDSMRKQIMSRAFYGWLAHTRHIRTVRLHLTGIVKTKCDIGEQASYASGLTKEIWDSKNQQEIYKAIYWGGVPKNLRATVWPVLLGFHTLDMSEDEVQQKNRAEEIRFEDILSQWGPLEIIVKENDKEFVTSARDLLQKKLEKERQLSEKRRKDKKGKGYTLTRQKSEETMTYPIVVDQAGEPEEAGGLGVDADASSRLSTSRESLVSPASPASNGGIYSPELIENIATNWHRIDKDVNRCDRHIPFFTNPQHLDQLRTIMCSFVWEELEVGYIQGFCDLLAPLLVVLEKDWLTLACFKQLMAKMVQNFPGGAGDESSVHSAMDTHLGNMRALIQVLDPQLYEHMVRRGDYTHFYFCYRWFLLDFKRELYYNDVFLVWETIWAAAHLVTANFNTFIAMAMLEIYRGIILDNDMDFTDIIKFYNEMAERHNVSDILICARDLVKTLSALIDNK